MTARSAASPRASLDPQAMLVFAAIARARGVRGAAELLGVPRSTVSRRLAQLEASLGVVLVVRTTRRFALTDLGALLAARATDLEEHLRKSEEALRRATEEPSGRLRVDVAPVLGEVMLAEVIDEIVRRHPRLEIDVRTSADYVDLRRGVTDVALRASTLGDATDLFALRLGTSITGCWVSPSYAAAHGVPRSPSDLASHACILVGSAAPMRWTLRVGARDEVVRVSGRVRVDSYRIARDLAVLGVGVLRTAQIFAEPLAREGTLVPILERHWTKTPIHAVHAGANPPPLKVRAFIDLAKTAVARALRDVRAE